MIREFFSEDEYVEQNETAIMVPKKLYFQERDWTCVIACIRSITSSIRYIGTEMDIINDYSLYPKPRYSKDIKELHILDSFDTLYGCDFNKNYGIKYLYDLLKDNYYIAVESMINYDHWLVLCGYFPNSSNNISQQSVLLYDPYFNELRIYRAEEFCSMWLSGEHLNNNIKFDFIAVKHKETDD